MRRWLLMAVAVAFGFGLLACTPSPWGKAIVTSVNGEQVCFYDTNWGNACVPATDFADLGSVEIGDCLELRMAREAAEVKQVRRSSGCPPAPASTERDVTPSGTVTP
jgi:hypothetical protein